MGENATDDKKNCDRVLVYKPMPGNKAKACMTNTKRDKFSNKKMQKKPHVGGNVKLSGQKHWKPTRIFQCLQDPKILSNWVPLETDRKVQMSSPGARDPSYITSQSTHFLKVPHLRSVKGGSTMERWLFLFLKSAVKWQGNINEMGQNRENELMNKQMDGRVRWIDMNKYRADR